MADVRHALMDADKSAKLKPQIAIPRKAAPDRSFPDVIYSAAPHERSSANTARTGFHHHSAYNRAAAPLVRSRARVSLYEPPLVGLPTLSSLDASSEPRNWGRRRDKSHTGFAVLFVLVGSPVPRGAPGQSLMRVSRSTLCARMSLSVPMFIAKSVGDSAAAAVVRCIHERRSRSQSRTAARTKE
jgi:hypothetical protein